MTTCENPQVQGLVFRPSFTGQRAASAPDRTHFPLNHFRIMVRFILNFVIAESACGTFAGKMIVSPSFI